MITIDTLDLAAWLLSAMVIGFAFYFNRVWGRQSLMVAHAKLHFLAEKLAGLDLSNDPEAAEAAKSLNDLIVTARQYLPYALYQGASAPFSAEGRHSFPTYLNKFAASVKNLQSLPEGETRRKLSFIHHESFKAVRIYAMFGSPLAWVTTSFAIISLIALVSIIVSLKWVAKKTKLSNWRNVLNLFNPFNPVFGKYALAFSVAGFAFLSAKIGYYHH